MLTVVPVCSSRCFYDASCSSPHRIYLDKRDVFSHFRFAIIIYASISREYLLFFYSTTSLYFMSAALSPRSRCARKTFSDCFFLLFTRARMQPIADGSPHETGESLCRPNRAYITRRSG